MSPRRGRLLVLLVAMAWLAGCDLRAGRAPDNPVSDSAIVIGVEPQPERGDGNAPTPRPVPATPGH